MLTVVLFMSLVGPQPCEMLYLLRSAFSSGSHRNAKTNTTESLYLRPQRSESTKKDINAHKANISPNYLYIKLTLPPRISIYLWVNTLLMADDYTLLTIQWGNHANWLLS